MRFKYNKYKIILSILITTLIQLFFTYGYKVILKKRFVSFGSMDYYSQLFIFLISILFLFIFIYNILKAISFFILLLRKTHAVIITDDYIADYSYYYSFGKIPWDNVLGLNIRSLGFGAKCVELHLDTEFYRRVKLNMFQKILRWADHYSDMTINYVCVYFVENKRNEFVDKIISTYTTRLDNVKNKN